MESINNRALEIIIEALKEKTLKEIVFAWKQIVKDASANAELSMCYSKDDKEAAERFHGKAQGELTAAEYLLNAESKIERIFGLDWSSFFEKKLQKFEKLEKDIKNLEMTQLNNEECTFCNVNKECLFYNVSPLCGCLAFKLKKLLEIDLPSVINAKQTLVGVWNVFVKGDKTQVYEIYRIDEMIDDLEDLISEVENLKAAKINFDFLKKKGKKPDIEIKEESV